MSTQLTTLSHRLHRVQVQIPIHPLTRTHQRRGRIIRTVLQIDQIIQGPGIEARSRHGNLAQIAEKGYGALILRNKCITYTRNHIFALQHHGGPETGPSRGDGRAATGGVGLEIGARLIGGGFGEEPSAARCGGGGGRGGEVGGEGSGCLDGAAG
ncbi:hypothetical protein BGAL_0038g00340 [Botrytis galanthina]|uniref:Uncharacterized protein n=1 Tax=Botrytis galanthina TaxID=278940 RepID=A0A4V4HVN5_9HELO|nr:hypothetical protein BGAL_0038g00340 [Botrytis galanthina]